MSLYSRVADLPLEIDRHRLEPLELHTGGGWTRHTTVVRLKGGGHEGVGEDVVYDEADQLAFRKHGATLDLGGRCTLDEFSHRLDALPLFDRPLGTPGEVLYRRWAFESAALDLALRQSGQSLAAVLDRAPKALTFVVSLGLGKRPSVAPIRDRLALYPGLRFKVDLAAAWTRELVVELAAAVAVATVDLKGQYRGAFRGPMTNVEQYRWVAELLPDAWIEDPDWTPDTAPVFEGHRERITWDANLHSLADIVSLPFEPSCINVKPSRFGMISELFQVYEYCEAKGIAMYGGGQFELGPGRGQIQYLASLFHPDAANDVAPSAFNHRELREDLPGSPLPPAPTVAGFRWHRHPG